MEKSVWFCGEKQTILGAMVLIPAKPRGKSKFVSHMGPVKGIRQFCKGPGVSPGLFDRVSGT